MLMKTITYDDLDGKSVTEDFYFKLSEAEAAELELGYRGEGLSTFLMRALAAEDKNEIIQTFKMLIAMSVGRRSENGRRFVKNDEVRDDFMQSDAYSTLFMELMSNADRAVEFFKGILPKHLAEKAEAEMNEEKTYTDEQLLAMSDDEFHMIAGTDPSKMSKQMLMIAFRRRDAA